MSRHSTPLYSRMRRKADRRAIQALAFMLAASHRRLWRALITTGLRRYSPRQMHGESLDPSGTYLMSRLITNAAATSASSSISRKPSILLEMDDDAEVAAAFVINRD